MMYREGQNITLGCGYYALTRSKSGHLKAEEISIDPECVKRVEKEKKRRIKNAIKAQKERDGIKGEGIDELQI